MKKISLLSLLIISGLSLGACQPKSTESKPASTEPSQSSTTSSTKQETIDYHLYDQTISDYASVVNGNSISGLDINLLANQVNNSAGFYTSLEYSQTDLDKNGTEELLIALVNKEGGRALLDLRTIREGQVIRLTNQHNQLDLIGERMFLSPLEDGSLLFKGSSSATEQSFRHYSFNSSGTDLEIVTEGSSEADLGSLAKALDLSSLNWKSIDNQETANTPSSQTQGMDITAIQSGDYSSIAGTWTNDMGMSLTFDANGLVSDTSMIVNIGPVDGFLKSSLQGKTGGPGGMAVAFLPSGVRLTESVTSSPNSGFTDPSDTSKDRIWAGQQLLPEPRAYYYKVD